MGAVQCAIHALGLFFTIHFPDIFYMHDGQKVTFRIAEGNGLTGLQSADLKLGYIETDWNRPQDVIL